MFYAVVLRLISQPSNLSGEDFFFVFVFLEYVCNLRSIPQNASPTQETFYETFSSDGWVCSVFLVAKRITEKYFAVGIVHLIPRFYAIV